MLDCGEKRIGTVRILGATLWSDFRIVGDGPAREQAMEQATAFSRDFSRITVDEKGQEVFTRATARRSSSSTRAGSKAGWPNPSTVKPWW